MNAEPKSRLAPLKTPLFAGLVLACGLFTGNSQAQWVVTDPGHTVGTFADMAQSWTEFLEQARRYQEQLRQYREALALTGRIFESPTLMMPLDLKTRAEDFGAREACPSPDGSSLPSITSFLDAVTPDLNGDILKDQQRVCINIVHLQNKKYNQLVEMVMMAEKRKSAINKMIQDAKSDNTDGAQKAAMIKAQELMGQTLAEMQYSQARVQAFDGMIASLTNDQRVLAQKALRGSQNPLQGLVGAMVQGATLEVALQGLRSRER